MAEPAGSSWLTMEMRLGGMMGAGRMDLAEGGRSVAAPADVGKAPGPLALLLQGDARLTPSELRPWRRPPLPAAQIPGSEVPGVFYPSGVGCPQRHSLCTCTSCC